MLSLCLVCHEYPPGCHGGIGTFTQLLARALVTRGHRVRVVGVYRASEDLREWDEGVDVWRLAEQRGVLGWLRSRRKLFRLVAGWSQRGDIDIVEVPDYQGWAAGWPRLSVPVIVRVHGSSVYLGHELGQPTRWSEWLIEWLNLQRASAWCGDSEYGTTRTRELFHLRRPADAVIYLPVDIPGKRTRCARHAGRVVFAGTLSEQKGVVALMQAWRTVVAECPRAELHLYGKDGAWSGGASMRSFLVSQLPERMRQSVMFHGHVERQVVLQALAGAGAAVFPSFVETFANAPLEAMATGCPTVYTHRCSGPEVITDGVSGVLVDPERPDEIAGAIMRVLRDAEFARQLGDAGLNSVRRRFSPSVVIPENERFYERCIVRFQARSGGGGEKGGQARVRWRRESSTTEGERVAAGLDVREEAVGGR